MIVRVFTQPKCQPCRLTKKKLDQLGVRYEEIPVDGSNIGFIRSLGYSAAPVVEADFGEGATAHWAGYRPDFLRQLYDTLSRKPQPGRVTTPAGK